MDVDIDVDGKGRDGTDVDGTRGQFGGGRGKRRGLDWTRRAFGSGSGSGGGVSRPSSARSPLASGADDSSHVVLGLGVRERDEAFAIVAVVVVRDAVHLRRAQCRPPLGAILLRAEHGISIAPKSLYKLEVCLLWLPV